MENIPQVSPSKDSRKWMISSVVGFILVSVAVSIFYFGYWKKTPEYSMGIIMDAVKTHDVVKFQRHVDLDSLLSRAFDDIITTSMAKEQDTDLKSMAAGFAQLFKQPAINAMKDGIKRYVETGSFEENEKGKPVQAKTSTGETAKISPKEMGEKAGLSNTDFKGVAYTKKEGKTAIVGLKVWEKQVAKEFVLDIKMRELDDGTWQVAELANLSSYIAQIEEAKMKKLAELNRPIEEQLKTALTIGKVTSKKVSKDRWGFSNMLEVIFPVTFNDDRSIVELAGSVIVKDQDKQLLKGTFSSTGTTYKGKNSILKYSWDLNPYISGHKTILSAPDNTLGIEVIVRKIKYSDGTEIHILDELPKS